MRVPVAPALAPLIPAPVFRFADENTEVLTEFERDPITGTYQHSAVKKKARDVGADSVGAHTSTQGLTPRAFSTPGYPEDTRARPSAPVFSPVLGEARGHSSVLPPDVSRVGHPAPVPNVPHVPFSDVSGGVQESWFRVEELLNRVTTTADPRESLVPKPSPLVDLGDLTTTVLSWADEMEAVDGRPSLNFFDSCDPPMRVQNVSKKFMRGKARSTD